MTACRVVVRTQDSPGASAAALANAWVYWREGSTTTVLRTNSEGLLTVVGASLDGSRPKSYGSPFTTSIGTQVQLHYSSGDKPTPPTRLTENGDAFVARTIALPPPGQQPVVTVPIAPNAQNTVTAVAVAVVVIPRAEVTLATPSELALWPICWTLPSDACATDGLKQGAAIWNANGALTAAEGQAAPAPADKVRPRELGLMVEGSIAASVTSAEVSVLAADGSFIPLKSSANATTSANALALVLAAPAGTKRAFKGEIFFARPANALGAVQVMIRSTAGITPRLVGTYLCPLVGVQVGLGMDSADGQSAGKLPSEQDDALVVDFLQSPKASKADLSAQARTRRMVRYPIGMRDRLVPDTSVTAVTPEMPLWMAELQLVGLTCADWEDLLTRKRDRSTSPAPFIIAPSLQLDLDWDGPDITTADKPYQYKYTLSSPAYTVSLELDAAGHLKGKNADVLSQALKPAPTAIPYPVANRRLPAVRIDQTRAWGRQVDAVTRPALVIEWQPRIEAKSREVIRGGNGVLKVSGLSFEGKAIAGPAAASPVAATPTFRVFGENPSEAALKTLADALVEKYYNANASLDRVAALTLKCWQGTVRALLFHEAGMQFDARPSGRRGFDGLFYGHEHEMPIFGAPHGYGFGQLDTPRATHDQVWSFLENLRGCVELVMDTKAATAWSELHAHFSTPLSRADKAVYRRQIVRRYNGGSEFKWNATSNQFVIEPSKKWEDASDHSKGPNQRLPYANSVLGTSIVYTTGSGATTNFPWPITFSTADYGPDI